MPITGTHTHDVRRYSKFNYSSRQKKVPILFRTLRRKCLLNANKMLSGCQNARKTVSGILSVKLAKSNKIVL